MKFTTNFKNRKLLIFLLFIVISINEISSKKKYKIKPSKKERREQRELEKVLCINTHALAPIKISGEKPTPTDVPNISMSYSEISGTFTPLFNSNLYSIENTDLNKKVLYTSTKKRIDTKIVYEYTLERVIAVQAGEYVIKVILIHKLSKNTNNNLFPYNTLNISFEIVADTENRTNGFFIDKVFDEFEIEGFSKIVNLNEVINRTPYYIYKGSGSFNDCVQDSIWIQLEKQASILPEKMQTLLKLIKNKYKNPEKLPLNKDLITGKKSLHGFRKIYYHKKAPLIAKKHKK